MRKILMVISIFVIQFSCISLFAEVPPIIKVNEIAQVTLKIFYEVGQFQGYIIFFNREGKQCAVAPPKPERRYMVPYLIAKDYSFEKRLDITSSNFKTLELRGGGVIYAYEVEPFIINTVSQDEKITFRFEWFNLDATDTVYVW